MIDYRYEVFLTVARKLSFSKAAQELFVTQPSISKHIKLLEQEAGVALFQRKGNSVFLTPTGERLLGHLQKARLIQQDIKAEFEASKKSFEVKGDLRIGASTTISLYVIPKILASFHQEYPNAKVLLINRNSENILKALFDQEVDLACVESGNKLNAISSLSFMSDEIIPVCSGKSNYRMKEMQLNELAQAPVVLREQGSGTLDALVKGLALRHVKLSDLKIVARLGGTEALKNYLIEGEAIGFLSRLAVRKELDSGTLVEVKIPELRIERDFHFVMRKGEEGVGVIKYFTKIAQRHYNH